MVQKALQVTLQNVKLGQHCLYTFLYAKFKYFRNMTKCKHIVSTLHWVPTIATKKVRMESNNFVILFGKFTGN